jgi:hypothetical protein
MGLMGDWIKSKNMKDPVKGTLQVAATTYPPDGATSGNYSLNGVVSGDGIPPTAIEHAGIAKTKKWPQNGQTLPVTVDRADPTRVHIEWDEVEDSWASARSSAEKMAEMMRSGGTATAAASSWTSPTGDVSVNVTPPTVIDASGIPGVREDLIKVAMSGGTPEQIMNALKEHGVQIPDAANMQMFTAGAAAAPAEEDPATRLRKLQDLKRDGLITEDEYEAQRTKVLGEI